MARHWTKLAIEPLTPPLLADARLPSPAGDFPLATSPARLTGIAVVAIVALRLAIGLHFYLEGVNKLRDPKPFSAGFFGNAKGPLAPFFHGLVWDADGTARLDAEATSDVWQKFQTGAKNHFRYDTEQIEQADKLRTRREGQLKAFLGARADEINEYKDGLKRSERNRTEAARREVPSLRGQSEKWDAKLKTDRGPWLADLDKLAKDFERDLNELATPDQRHSRGYLKLTNKPGRSGLDSEAVDRLIPYFDLTIGLLLMCGLLTRCASITGAAFLLSVVLSQWPGSSGAIPAYNQAVEMFALLALAAVGAGRYAGLDFLLGLVRMKCCPPKRK